MNFNRRHLLKMGLGASQLAMLDGMGLLTRNARADVTNGPKRLLTLYLPGGWQPWWLFPPLAASEINRMLPTQRNELGEACYFRGDQVANLDGSGDAGADTATPRIRTPRLWHETMMSAGTLPPQGTPLPSNTSVFSSELGWSWAHHRLWENTCIVHGFDVQTASHESGTISSMCGVPGADYRSPAVHSVVANALFNTYGDARPLPCVSIGGAPIPNPLSLSAHGSPTRMDSVGSVGEALSQRNTYAWTGVTRQARAQTLFGGGARPDVSTTLIEQHGINRARALRGRTSAGTDALLQQLHDGMLRTSSLLARDVTSILEGTEGVPLNAAIPFWAPKREYKENYFSLNLGYSQAGGDGAEWYPELDLALRLMKTDMASAISVTIPSILDGKLDTHGADANQFPRVFSCHEIVGRFLGLMKDTPTAGGRTLLDDTLVMVFSEFSRTWNGNSDHWPITSVAFAGGGIQTNRMLGGYATENLDPFALGYMGKPLAVHEESGEMRTRATTSADVIHTALRVMGVEQFFIPGGSGEIMGVRA